MPPKLKRPSAVEDAAVQRGIAADPDNPEWTAAEFAAARPAAEVVPAVVAAQARRTRGPQKAPTKALVSLRLDQDVLERLKAEGPGWQTRVNAMLRAAVMKQRRA